MSFSYKCRESLTAYCNRKANEKAIAYKLLKTNTNDPTISKKMAYSQLIRMKKTTTTVTGAQYAAAVANGGTGTAGTAGTTGTAIRQPNPCF